MMMKQNLIQRGACLMANALAKRLNMPVRVCWADEDLGSNCGMIDLVYNPTTDEVECYEVMTRVY